MERIHQEHYVSNDFHSLEHDKEVARLIRENIKVGLRKLKRIQHTKETKQIKSKQVKMYELTLDVIRLILIDRKTYAEKQVLLVSKADEEFKVACERFLK
jgi:hypothetical protein